MNNDIVASAIASFNNQALAGGGFFWLGILSLPILYLIWQFSPQILANYFPSERRRNGNLAFVSEIALFAWLLLAGGNWAAIRDGAGYLPFVIGVVLFLLARDIILRLRENNPALPECWRRQSARTRAIVKILLLAAFAAAIYFSAAPEWEFKIMQFCAVLFGISAGCFSSRPSNPVPFSTFILLAVAAGIMLQPEFFRFGQLGHLTIFHLGAMMLLFALGAMIFVFRFFRPSGFIKDNHYDYVAWFMRVGLVLAISLFFMTESVIGLAGFFGTALVLVWLAAKHQPAGTNISGLTQNLWGLFLLVFGFIAGMPVISAAGVLALKKPGTGWRKKLWSVLK